LGVGGKGRGKKDVQPSDCVSIGTGLESVTRKREKNMNPHPSKKGQLRGKKPSHVESRGN